MDTLDMVVKLAALIIAPGSVVTLGWWLRGQFSEVKDAAIANLAQHEIKDQERHLQNLDRFASINVAIASMGYRKNGSYPRHQD